MNKGKTIIWILFSVLTFLIGITITYAYLAIRINNNETTSTVTFDTGTMEINYENNSGNIVLNKIIPGASVTKKFTLTGTNNTKINDNNTDNNMYYKIGIVVDNNTFSEDALRYSLTKDNESTNNGEQANNLNGSISQSGTRYIASGYFAEGANNAKHIYNLTISFPETGKDQSENQGATFACHIIIEQDRGLNDSSKTGVEFITDLYSSEERDNEGLFMDDTIDENIRFNGATPKNYVEFGNDGELWRIIGIFNATDSNGNTSKKLKIVRNESIGNFGYTKAETPNWKDTELNKELNNDYLNYSLTSNPIWYGNTSNVEFSKNYTIKSNYQKLIANTYWNIGFASLFPDSAYNTYNSEKNDKLLNKVGLISASDLAYASGASSTCSSDISLPDCRENNWIFSSQVDAFAITAYVDSILIVYMDRGLANVSFQYDTSVYPCVYLKSDTLILSGTGEASDPYKLG